MVLLNILVYHILILQVMPPYYENTSVNFCSDHTYFGTRIDHTLHYLGLAYPQNIYHFSKLPFHFKFWSNRPQFRSFSPLSQLHKHLSSKDHPYHKFSTGKNALCSDSCSRCSFWQLIIFVSFWTQLVWEAGIFFSKKQKICASLHLR